MNPKKPNNRPAAQSSRPASQPAKPAKPGKPKQPAKPGDGLFGWLGRQVGHVKKAAQTDVTKPAGKKPVGSKPKPATTATGGKKNAGTKSPRPAATPPAGNGSIAEQIIFRQDKVEEAELPDRPGVILRRTIIDEVVVEREKRTQ